MLRNEWQEIDAGIYQMRKYMKTKRIREKEERKKNLNFKIMLGVVIVLFTLVCNIIFIEYVASKNTKTTKDLVKIARCVDFGECEGVDAQYEGNKR